MWLAIEGIIGAGKTTTVNLLGKSSQFEAVLEDSGKHPFLEAYYSDPERHAVETELAFMLMQLHQVRGRSEEAMLATDFAPPKNLIFARMQLAGQDLEFIQAVDSYLWRHVASPDLTVFLDVPVGACLQRIRSRGRPYEQDLQVTYLERLRDGYMEALADLGCRTVLLELVGSETPREVARAVLDCTEQP